MKFNFLPSDLMLFKLVYTVMVDSILKSPYRMGGREPIEIRLRHS